MTTATPATRAERRRRLLVRSAAPAALALLIAAKLIGTPVLNAMAINAYEQGASDAAQYERSQRLLTQAGVLSVFERVIPPFNQGDVLFRMGDFVGAQAQFEEALTLASGDVACMVRVNLVLSIEAQGDALGDSPGATALYEAALARIDEAPECFSPTTERGEQAADRLTAAQERLSEQTGDEPAPDDTEQPEDEGEGNEDPQTPQESEIQQLTEQQNESAEQRTEEQQGNESRDYAPADSGDARW